MNGFQDGKKMKLEKPVPGCLGRMVNIFDLGLVARNKLIADKPYSEGSSISRCQSDVARTNPSGDQNRWIEGEMFMTELRKSGPNKTPNGTPIKTLIDQEMSNEIAYAHNPPSVVAKLMGLDALPPQQLDITTQRSHSIAHSRSRSETVSSYWKEDGYLGSELEHEVAHCSGQRDYTDIYETCPKAGRSNSIRDKSPSKGRCVDTTNEKNMALVRQKFMEAKSLATDERLRQSKQFLDALEVLSTNKDSLLKFLQEPNALSSQHLYNMQSVPSTPDTKRITVLKPSKMVDNCKFPVKNNEKRIKKTSTVNRTDKTPPGFAHQSANRKADECSSQPTRIVVLKPSPGRPHDPKSMASLSSSSPRISAGEELFGEFDHEEANDSREVAMSIAHQMRENFGGQWRDENSECSMYPDGYIGDESSFNISETEYAAENLTDSEVMSPTSRHSWDYINKFDSPLSSSFSRASYSPESSVCREAKKRLSERWSMMSSNGSYQEPKHVRKNSSTLGEMLALSDIKKVGGSKETITNIDEPIASSSLLSSNLDDVNGTNDSPKNLVRSKSLPLPSTQPCMKLNVDSKDPEHNRSEVPRNAENGKSSKSLFMGKVSSLFFSRNKKMGREKSSMSQSRKESYSEACSSSPENFDGGAEYQGNVEPKSSSVPLSFSSNQLNSLACSGKQIYPEAGLFVRKALASGTSGKEVSAYGTKSNLIDKSPPIGSIARTLSWDDSCTDTASSYPLKISSSIRSAEEEEEEWLFFVRSLLSAVGLDGDVPSNSVLSRWHSSESPLDPSLRDKYIDLNSKDILQGAKRRQRRSMQKFVFDCVNATLLDLAVYGSETGQRANPHSGFRNRLLISDASFKMVDEVWGRMKDWVYGENRCVIGDDSVDVNSLFIVRVIGEELAGKAWDEHYKLEVDCFANDLEKRLLDDLVQELVVELVG